MGYPEGVGYGCGRNHVAKIELPAQSRRDLGAFENKFHPVGFDLVRFSVLKREGELLKRAAFEEVNGFRIVRIGYDNASFFESAAQGFSQAEFGSSIGFIR